jgi:hypothetical protein
MADGVGMAAATGAGSGALKGASLGATIGSVIPGVGTAVGAGAGAIAGAVIGGVSSGTKKKNAVEAMDAIQAESLEERALQRFFARRKRAYMTGTANNLDRAALTSGLKTGINNAFKYGASTRGLNAISQMYQQGLMGLNQQGQQIAMQYGAQEAATINNMVQRRLELSLLKASQASAEAAQQTTEDKQNVGVGLMKGLDGLNQYNDNLSKANFASTQNKITMKTPLAPKILVDEVDTGLTPIDLASTDNLSGNWAGGFTF